MSEKSMREIAAEHEARMRAMVADLPDHLRPEVSCTVWPGNWPIDSEQTQALDGSGPKCDECDTPASHVCPDCGRGRCNEHAVLMPDDDAMYCPGCREVKP